jgi:3-dehydroquinate synthase
MSVIQRHIQVGYDLRVFFTRGVFAPANPLLRDVLLDDANERHHRVMLVLDESLAQARPKLVTDIEAYFARASKRLELVCPPMVIEGGPTLTATILTGIPT